MPKVGKTEFPYTPSGRKRARQAARKRGMPVVHAKKSTTKSAKKPSSKKRSY